MISVVGIGPGHPDYITPIALKKIQSADVIIGGRRQLKMCEGVSCTKILFDGKLDLEKALANPGNVVVLASGDPTIYGILDKILSLRKKEEIEVISGISCIQYMLGKLKMPMKDVCVISLHGREQELIKKVEEYKSVAVLTDKIHSPCCIAQSLRQAGIVDVKIYVGENLSYENEKIREFSVEELAESTQNFDLNVVVITRCGSMDSASLTSFL